MAVKFDVDCAYNKSGYRGQFQSSLRRILQNLNQDSNIDNTRVAAYLLGTASAESSYSLQRWEADYSCNSRGVAMYPPCQTAINYYNSTTIKGGTKRDYRTLGVDKNGIAYYGRGLIQLTGKSNYKVWGDKIGVDLVNSPELALSDNNSYLIASIWINTKSKKYILTGDLVQARRSVNGGTNGIDAVNSSYNKWYQILTSCGAKEVTGGSNVLADNSPSNVSQSFNNIDNTTNNDNNSIDNNSVDLSSSYADINAFLLTGKSMSDAVINKKETNGVSSKDQEVPTKTILNPTHKIDQILNPGVKEST